MPDGLEMEGRKNDKFKERWSSSVLAVMKGRYLFMCVAAGLLLLLIIVVLILYFTTFGIALPAEQATQPSPFPSEYINRTTTVKPDLSDNFKIVTRVEWGAKPNTKEHVPIPLPVQHVIILHTATPACLTEDSCKGRIQQIQDNHMNEKHFDDIGYSFLVGGDGNVYEGRGWDVRGAFAYGYNSRSIGIAFIGEFKDVLPTKEQMQAGQQLVQRGVQLGKVAHDYKLLGHRQVSRTESPGDAFYNVIKTWPHWEDIQQEPN
ncbi:peptidoglycan-recognition protein SD-like [Periplaneta americana]|uniref:peptidoglycan-recognition protein SD-like n=1 Tax=Periplaneta americana TaxID=6978 RepID=UPI0037E80792